MITHPLLIVYSEYLHTPGIYLWCYSTNGAILVGAIYYLKSTHCRWRRLSLFPPILYVVRILNSLSHVTYETRPDPSSNVKHQKLLARNRYVSYFLYKAITRYFASIVCFGGSCAGHMTTVVSPCGKRYIIIGLSAL